MVVFPNCKINIGLNILDKRPDGFHDLETVFIPVPLNDSLEIIKAKENNQDVAFSQSGIMIDGPPQDNLCVKAYHLLKRDFPALPAVEMHLHKAIPPGAGLGGGSADAAFTLQLLNTKFHLNLSSDQLISYSLILGSDCPFFIINTACYAAGRGEMLQPLQLSLEGFGIILVNPGIHINTGWAFNQLHTGEHQYRPSKNLLHAITQPIQTWQNSIFNDFEKPVFAVHPVLNQVKEILYQNGAIYAAMSGTGSTVFGLFDKGQIPTFHCPPEWMITQAVF